MDSENALNRYFSVLEGRKKARYLSCRKLMVKADTAKDIMKSCHFCERRCSVDRLRGEKGYCGVLESRVASEFIHMGEEPELVPSYTIFFSGCTFSCVYCQNWDISQYPKRGTYIKPEILAKMISSVNAKNVNWVGGDPTPNLSYILEVLTHLNKNIPQIWNSNMYLTEESMRLLNDVMDVYLTDFKYGNDKCAERLSDVRNYCGVVERNHRLAEKQGEVIIRHLVLPGHLDCCTKPLLKWISENMGCFRLNIMDQYRPEYKAATYDELQGRLGFGEYQEALGFARDLGLI
ncbi:MAG: radical SAM protein [Candidatus Altiarchaeota archaeon]|nr:radical SAM protein [Candidatus Altiarchaeota archaeon]